MNTAEQLFAGSDATLPLLEACNLGELFVDEQLMCFEGILKTISGPAELFKAIRERDDRLRYSNPAAYHLLGLATAYKGNMTKYLLAAGGEATDVSGNGYKVWINKYDVRPGESQSDLLLGPDNRPYVERVHNHRFGLASLNVGPKDTGYGARMFLRQNKENYQAQAGRTTEEWSQFVADGTQRVEETFKPGDVWSMHHDEAHRLQDIRPGTITLVMETGSARDFSVQFDDEGTVAEKIIPGWVDRRGSAFDDM